MHRFAVEVEHWMTDRQFADLFALAQVTPGPNVIIVTLIGYHVAGVAGALVATLAMCGPTCVFAFLSAMCGSASKTRAGGWRSRPACFRSPSACRGERAVVARASAQTWVSVAADAGDRGHHLPVAPQSACGFSPRPRCWASRSRSEAQQCDVPVADGSGYGASRRSSRRNNVRQVAIVARAPSDRHVR